MAASTTATRRWLPAVCLLAAAAAAAAWLLHTRALPLHGPPVETALTVRTIEVAELEVTPRAVGYGEVSPGTVWEGIAEVAGRVVAVHDKLEVGAILPAGAELLRIDRTDYDLALAQAEADIGAVEAQLAELGVRERNVRAALAIEQAALELVEAELERQRRLVAQGTVSRSVFDSQEREVLAQRQLAQTQTNALELLPAERRVLEAQLARLRTIEATARRNIERTMVRLPMDARIESVQAERDQFAKAGEVLVVADGIVTAEVSAQIPVAQMRALIPPGELLRTDITSADLRAALGLGARVRHPEAGEGWEGRFARIGPEVDPRTRTVGVIVEVDEPYRRALPGVRPPRVKGMFVEVDLRGRPRPALPIPRSALHGDRVYLVTPSGRLERRPVEVGLRQPGFVVISAGVEPGERIVVSDLSPAIDGMLLVPVDDPGTRAKLERDVSGDDGAGEPPAGGPGATR